MNSENLTFKTLTDVSEMTDADIRLELEVNGIDLHHKTGTAKLISTLTEVRNGTYVAGIAPKEEKKKAPVPAVPLTKTQLAMRMQRIVVTPNDPLMSTYPGLIFSSASSKVNKGRMVKKFVPFNNEEGWHVPQILIDQIEGGEMQKFKQVLMPDGKTKVMQPYFAKKFNVRILPPLTVPEMEALAAAQQSRGGI